MFAKPVKATAKPFPMPAPAKGLDAMTNLMQMDPAAALYLYNLNPTQYGCRARPGYQNWSRGLDAALGGVRTVIPVRGGNTAGTNNFLFAVTPGGIYDVTSGVATKVVTFAITTGNAGWGKSLSTTDPSGNLNVAYCDEANGYYTFAATTNTWTKVTQGTGAAQVSGVDPATFVDCIYYAGRLMFVQAGTGTGWYLNTNNAIYGVAAPFYFGAEFGHGGNLNSYWSYTIESTFFLLEYLVTISDAGDVVLWQGTDITNASSWTLKGRWYVGDLPAGRRVASTYGGDLLILSQFGAIAVSNLLNGVSTTDPDSFITQKIAPALVRDIAATAGVRGWDIVPWSSENGLLVIEPLTVSTTPRQYFYNLVTKGWSIYQSLPIQCSAAWQSNLYSGTADGRVLLHTGTQDNVGQGATSSSIQWGALGAFTEAAAPGLSKMVGLIRPIILADNPVGYTVFARYNYDLSTLTGSPPAATAVQSGWDSGIWDSLLWSGGGVLTPQIATSGATGTGSSIAIGILGNSSGNATLVGYEILGMAGGFM